MTILSDALEKYKYATISLHGENLNTEYTNKAGFKNVVENPMIKTQLKYAELIKKYAVDFGLTPAARLKIIQQSMPDIDFEEEDFNEDFNNV